MIYFPIALHRNPALLHNFWWKHLGPNEVLEMRLDVRMCLGRCVFQQKMVCFHRVNRPSVSTILDGGESFLEFSNSSSNRCRTVFQNNQCPSFRGLEN